MKRFVVLAVMGTLIWLPLHAIAAERQVRIRSTVEGYRPQEVTIKAGDTVKWTNDDKLQPHTVTGRDGGFDSGTIESGATYSRPFPKEGEFAYYCAIHGDAMPGGVVRVQAAAPPTQPPSTSPSVSSSPSASAKLSPSPTSTSPTPEANKSPTPTPTATESVTGSVEANDEGPDRQQGRGRSIAKTVAIIATIIAALSGAGLWYLRRSPA